MRLALVTVMAMSALGCGGTAIDDGSASPGAQASAGVAGPAAVAPEGRLRGADLDFGDKPAITGFVRYHGGCEGAFPYHLQHPSGWQVSGNHLGVSLERTGDATFGIRVGDDMGSAHVTRRLTALRQSGAVTVGAVTIGGQPVEVLAREKGTYVLFAPHPWGDEGVGYQELIVGSTFGDDVTMQVLASLAPLRC